MRVTDTSSIRILYSNKDLFEAVTSLRDPNYSTNRSVLMFE